MAHTKANLHSIEQRCELAAAQLEATLGIVEETEKRMKRMGGQIKGMEKRKAAKKTKESMRNDREKRQRQEATAKKTTWDESEADAEESGKEQKRNVNRKGTEQSKERATNGKGSVIIPGTPEWGGWEDVKELSPFEPTQESPSPSSTAPPPNQLQQRQKQQTNNQHDNQPNETQRQERSEEPFNPAGEKKRSTAQGQPTETWAEKAAKAASERAVFERIRELECQVFVDFQLKKGQADVWKHKGGRDLTIKANELINKDDGFDLTGKPTEALIWGAHRIGEGKYIFDVNSPVAANWLRTKGNRDAFAKGLSEGAIVILRSYPVIVKYVPTTFDIDNPEEWAEIVKKARGTPDSVAGTRWVKDPSRRKPNQKFAYLVVDFKNPEAANNLISAGAYIHGKRCDAKKYRMDPYRCNKCQKFGHVTAICKSDNIICGHCSEDHWTSQCNEENKTPRCANCRSREHGAKNTECRIFEERTKLQDERNPDRKLKYYPTVQAWTHEYLPEYKSTNSGTYDSGTYNRSEKSSQ